MDLLKRSFLVKLSFDFFIFIFFIFTIVFGTIEVIWHIQEFESSQTFDIVWIYGIISYPIKGLGLILNIVLSIFFSQGIIIQIIYYKDFGISSGSYKSLLLCFLAIIISPFIYLTSVGYTNAFYMHDIFYDHIIEYSTIILPGFHFGLLTVSLIQIKYIILKYYGNIKELYHPLSSYIFNDIRSMRYDIKPEIKLILSLAFLVYFFTFIAFFTFS